MYVTSLPPKAQESSQEREQKVLGPVVWVTIQEQCPLDTAGQLYVRTHSGCASMHKTLVSPSQTKPQQKEVRWLWSPPWSERSTTIGNCRRRECQFSLGTLLQPCRKLHIQQYLGSTGWTWWLLQKKKKKKRIESLMGVEGWCPGSSWGRGKDEPDTFYRILKEVIKKSP